MNTNNFEDTIGVILAGGLSQRMGKEDKFFLKHQDKTLLQIAIDRAKPQVSALLLSANGNADRFTRYQLKVLSDGDHKQAGPLAGVVSAMHWAQKAHPKAKWLMTFASDTPSFPLDCVKNLKMLANAKHLDVAICSTGDQHQYTFALWSIKTLGHLNSSLTGGVRAIRAVIKPLKHDFFVYESVYNAFFNVNTPEDWAKFNQLDHTAKH